VEALGIAEAHGLKVAGCQPESDLRYGEMMARRRSLHIKRNNAEPEPSPSAFHAKSRPVTSCSHSRSNQNRHGGGKRDQHWARGHP
jgi:hypothetical protein